jgi:hypothetical protein
VQELMSSLFWNIVTSNSSVTCIPFRKARRDSSTTIVRVTSVLFRDLTPITSLSTGLHALINQIRCYMKHHESNVFGTDTCYESFLPIHTYR